jgi:peroxiredoxin family protein
MVYIVILALAAAVMISALKIRSHVSAVIIGALFVAFPTVTTTMIYRYTAFFYGVSTLLAVLAVWVLGRFRWSVAVSAVLIGISMGIYQAYAPLTIGLMVLQLILLGLEGSMDAKKLVIRGLWDCLALVLGLGLYFAGMKLTMAFFGMGLVVYQGISTMGNITVSQLPQLPATMLFYNGGAKLTVEGSDSLEDLKNMEAQGVEILTCGTCLNFYGLTEKLSVGSVTNMYTIVEKLAGAGKVMKP